MEQLTGIFGFERAVAEQAVDAIHSSMAAAAAADKDGATAAAAATSGIDVTACYNYILDAGLGSDRGGPVTPIDALSAPGSALLHYDGSVAAATGSRHLHAYYQY